MDERTQKILGVLQNFNAFAEAELRTIDPSYDGGGWKQHVKAACEARDTLNSMGTEGDDEVRELRVENARLRSSIRELQQRLGGK